MRNSPPALHRLTSVTYPGPQTDTYTYDAAGNRLTKNATSYTYGDAEQMLTAGGVSYGYDERGNQTSRGSDAFPWDHENRMAGLTIGSTIASYAYNGDGLRMSSTVGANTTGYVWDVAAGLPVILQDGTNTYVYGLGLIATYDGDAMTYRLTDGLGSTVNLCDASGNVLVTYTYDAFGAIRSQTGTSSNYWKFTGEQRDSESGFDYLRARYYDPATGRFVSKDPLAGTIEMPLSENAYVYVLNSPVVLIDPMGLAPEGYHEFSVNLCYWLCVNVGAQYTGLDDIHPKVGVGVGSPGVNATSQIYPDQTITVGDYCGGDFSGPYAPVGVQIDVGQGYSDSVDTEHGLVRRESDYAGGGMYIGTPGATITCGSVFGDVSPF